MKIIIPRKKSKFVDSLNQIKDAALEMQIALEKDDFETGPFNKRSIALHHSQVDEDPFNFFVVRRDVVGAKKNEVVMVVNPEIVRVDGSTKKKGHEGCISFPFRPDRNVHRFNRVLVTYSVPDEKGESLIKKEEEWVEGLMAKVFQHEIDHSKGINIY